MLGLSVGNMSCIPFVKLRMAKTSSLEELVREFCSEGMSLGSCAETELKRGLAKTSQKEKGVY